MAGRYHGKHTVPVSRGTVIGVAVAAALVLTAAAASFFPRPDPPLSEAGSGSLTGSESADVSASSAGGAVSQPDVSTNPQPDVSANPQPDVSAGPQPDISTAPPAAYDFSQPAPEREAVDNSYFQDAAFVGDSRTDGFMLYSGIGTGKNLTSNGLSIFKLTEKKALTIDGKDYTLLEALALEQYGKVYLSLGVNELGTYDDEGFYASYCDAIDQIRAVQPNAVIYIQGLIPLNEGKIREANGNKFNLTNEHLLVYNDLMRRAAEEKRVVYLDLYSEFVDENAELPREASRDGVHLVRDACKQWLAYLQTHTVDFDTLYPDGLPVVENTAPERMPEDGSVQG